jgi:hypothetical protein
MKRAHADYTGIEDALRPHQLRTLNELAATRGSTRWQTESLCCVVAVALAVDNLIADATDATTNQMLSRIASRSDIDVETLLRQQRRRNRRRLADR